MIELRVPEEIDAPRAFRLRDEVRAALAAATGPVLLRGSSACFCRGVSLAAVADAADARPAVRAVGDALHDLVHAPVPTVAIVEGPAVGGGVGLLAACDRVVATPEATFALPEMLYGLVPLLIAPVLRRRVTGAALTWMALSGVARTAQEAQNVGLVDEVVAPADVPRRVEALARLLGRIDRDALAVTRAHWTPVDLRTELDRAVDATVLRLVDPEVRARIAAFVRDGVPPWEGRR